MVAAAADFAAELCQAAGIARVPRVSAPVRRKSRRVVSPEVRPTRRPLRKGFMAAAPLGSCANEAGWSETWQASGHPNANRGDMPSQVTDGADFAVQKPVE